MRAAALALLLAGPAAAGGAPDLLLSRVTSPAGLPESQRLALRRALYEAAQTPTGRERAERFVAGGWRVSLSTRSFGLAMVEADGILKPVGKAGNTDAAKEPLEVTVDAALIEKAPEALRSVVAHEVLGHALSILEARAAKVGDAWNASTEDEMLAELVGDLVARETGGAYDLDGEDAGYNLFESTSAYARAQWTGRAGFVTSFAYDEVAAPAEALRSRLRFQDEERARLQAIVDGARDWELAILHFRTVHGATDEESKPLWDYVEESRATNEAALTELEGARGRVKDKLDYLALPEGLKLRATLASKPYAAFVAERSAEIARLRERLVKLGPGEKPAPPADSSRATRTDPRWDALEKKIAEDRRKNPDHWR